jgi:beta-lactamase superfamily II metal-dependent hydrolase
VEAEILNIPPSDQSSSSPPSHQLILRVQCAHLHLLFLPQLTPELSRELLALKPQSLHAEVLILPLGGSEVSSALALIHHIAPRIIISPADHLRRNGAPSGEWKQILAEEGREFFRQDETGAVIIDAEEEHPSVRSFLSPEKEVFLK